MHKQITFKSNPVQMQIVIQYVWVEPEFCKSDKLPRDVNADGPYLTTTPGVASLWLGILLLELFWGLHVAYYILN